MKKKKTLFVSFVVSAAWADERNTRIGTSIVRFVYTIKHAIASRSCVWDSLMSVKYNLTKSYLTVRKR